MLEKTEIIHWMFENLPSYLPVTSNQCRLIREWIVFSETLIELVDLVHKANLNDSFADWVPEFISLTQRTGVVPIFDPCIFDPCLILTLNLPILGG